MDQYEKKPDSNSENSHHRILCVFAHPDDEVFCAGGAIAKYSAEGADVMVLSVTQGDAGQIRDAGIATRRTLGAVREQELYESCRRLGAKHSVCLDFGDGTLKDKDPDVLVRCVVEVLRKFRPHVVITFGADGAYGHPDHIAIGAATTIACKISGDASRYPEQIKAGLSTYSPARLYHSFFPRNRNLMLEKLSHWLMEIQGDAPASGKFEGNPTDFLNALLMFSEETTLLNYSSDRIHVEWYPTGFYIIEQGETSKDLYLVLSGNAQAVKEASDGSLAVVGHMGPGTFFGEIGLAKNARRSAHVIVTENATCLVFSRTEEISFMGRGSEATITGGEDLTKSASGDSAENETDGASVCLDVTHYVEKKIQAMAAHRTQYPIRPEFFPVKMLEDLMGKEYYVQVLPKPELQNTLFP